MEWHWLSEKLALPKFSNWSIDNYILIFKQGKLQNRLIENTQILQGILVDM